MDAISMLAVDAILASCGCKLGALGASGPLGASPSLGALVLGGLVGATQHVVPYCLPATTLERVNVPINTLDCFKMTCSSL